jgi:hypothetical protein
MSTARSFRMNENGVVLVTSIVFMILLAMVGLTAVVMTTTDMKIGANYRDSEMAFSDSQAGIQYAIGKMEEGLKAWPRTFTLPTTGAVANPLISTFTAPTGFNFTYPSPEITELQIGAKPDIYYEFTSAGAGAQGGNVDITVRVERLPAFMFGVFGDELLDLGNMAGVYSYSHADCVASSCHPLDPGDSTGDGDIGSNDSVILRNNAIVDGDVALGEDTAGSDGVLTDQGGAVTGTMGADIPRVDPDPLGIFGGELAADFAAYSAANDNGTRITEHPHHADITFDSTPKIHTKFAGDSATLKGQPGGANFYFTEIDVDAKTALYVDTTLGPVNVYLTGELVAGNGSEVVNTTDASCGGGALATPCNCCVYSPPTLDCTGCTPGAPSDFTIYANSTNDPTEKITLGNSSTFSGTIYAPGIEVVMNNSADIYGSIMAKRVDIVNSVEVYFDTDIKDKMKSNDLKVVSWRDNRF